MIFEKEMNNYLNSLQEEMETLTKDIKFLKHIDEYYKIKKHLNDFLNDKNLEDRFIVMPGLRGLGKTTILYQIYNYLVQEKKINKKNILYISLDELTKYYDEDLLNVVDNFLKYTHKTSKVYLDEKIFLLCDESHYDKKWAISGKIIFDKTKNIFMIFTGSSAIDLEINGDVARRSLKETIFPNNFRDYLLLKYDISIDNEFSKTLENIIYFGNKKDVKKAIKLESDIYLNSFNFKNDPKIEFNEFLKHYGFPSTINLEEKRGYKEIFSVVNKIIENDIQPIKTFNSSTDNTIRRIIIYLALSREGLSSNQKIANYLSISPRLVNEILGVLEKTQLIFSIKPYGGGGKIVKKSWKYYFLSPSIKAAVNYEVSRFNLDNTKCLGALAENFVASTLFKLSQTRFQLMNIFYPSEKKESDFIIRTKFDEIVPIEVGIGKKTKSQLITTMENHNSKYGILISNRYSRIQQENNIIHIPLVSFGFL